MKIKKLWISDYKNIKDQWFKFEGEPLITLLVGKNGLGKSNLIEAITGVLRQLDLVENENELTTRPDKFFFDFEIEYQCNGYELKVIAKNTKLDIRIKNVNGKWEELKFSDFKRNKDTFLPQNVIVYYSGENKRIKLLFERHKEIRESKLKRGSGSHGEPFLGKLFYVEENYGELLFFLLWMLREDDLYKNLTNELFEEFAGIENASSIQLTLCNPSFYDDRKHLGVEKIVENGYRFSDPIWNLSGDVEALIRILFDNQIKTTAPPMFRDEEESNVKGLDEFIVFNSLDFESLTEELLDKFKTPIKVFDVLEAAYKIGIIYRISTTIVKTGQSVQHDFSELSEGEQQLITVIGLLLITSESDALYLFDEPDTHLNPNWQRDYARLLKKFNTVHSNSQVIVSTHSPLIVQSAEEADMFLFKRVNNQIIIDKNSHKIHNWRLDQVLVSEYFGFDSARPPSLDNYMILRERIINTYPLSKEDEDALLEFEEGFGVLPTGETISEIKSMQLMNQLIKNQNDQNQK